MNVLVTKAIRVHEMWAEVHPDSIEALLTLARSKATVGDFDAASAALEKVRELDPENTDVDRQTANLMDASGDGEGAVKMLTSYLRAEPDDATAWVHLGKIEFRAGHYRSARNALERAAILPGQDFDALLALAQLEAYNGDLDAAIELAGDLAANRELASEQATAAMAKSIFLFMAGRLEDALSVLEARESELRRSMPPLVYPQMMGELKSMMLTGLGRYEATTSMLDEMEAELVAPVDAVINIHRVSLHELTGDLAKAQAALEKLRFFQEEFEFPGRATVVSLIQARMAALQGRPDESVELVQNALESNRNSNLALNVETVHDLEIALARYLRAAGRAGDARVRLVAMLERHPNLAEARLELAEIEFEAGRRGPARIQLKQVLDQWSGADPEYRGYQRALALNAALSG